MTAKINCSNACVLLTATILLSTSNHNKPRKTMTTTQAIAGIERMLITVPSATQIDIALTILANNGCFCINYWHESGIAEKFTELWEERNDESAPVLTPAHWVRIKMICETWESQNGVMDSSDMEDILIDYIENEYQN